jgi:predicted dinucleotide-binding enzyme
VANVTLSFTYDPEPGDDTAAKERVTELLDVLGDDAVDIGTVADSGRPALGTPA